MFSQVLIFLNMSHPHLAKQILQIATNEDFSHSRKVLLTGPGNWDQSPLLSDYIVSGPRQKEFLHGIPSQEEESITLLCLK